MKDINIEELIRLLEKQKEIYDLMIDNFSDDEKIAHFEGRIAGVQDVINMLEELQH